MPLGPTMTADASGSWGCGAYCTLPSVHWFQIQWPTSWKDTHIAAKELLPLVISSAIWGHHWRGSCVRFVSDNQAVVHARSAKDNYLAHLIRCLFFFEAVFQFEHSASHIAGPQNRAADCLSRNRVLFDLSPGQSIPHAVTSITAAPSPQPQPLPTLEAAVHRLFAEGLASSTRATYSSAQLRYLNFCSELGASPLPLTECTLCLFAAFLVNEGLCAQSISVYLSAICHLQVSSGPSRSTWPWLQYVIRGIKRTQGPSAQVRLPITASIHSWRYGPPSSPPAMTMLLWAPLV